MKLSDGIRLGSMAISRQTYGLLFERRQGGERVASCALGSAYHAFGVLSSEALYALIPEAGTFMTVKCPGCMNPSGYSRSLFSVITHLNDDHRWTRERIADWLDTIGEFNATTSPVSEKESCGEALPEGACVTTAP